MTDNTINIGVRVETGQLKSGMNEAVAVVEKSTTQMSASFIDLKAKTAEVALAQERLASVQKMVGAAVREGSAATKLLTQYQDELAKSSGELAAAQRQVAAAAALEKQKIDASTYSVMESRLAMQVAARDIGIVLPRAITTLLSRMGGDRTGVRSGIQCHSHRSSCANCL